MKADYRTNNFVRHTNKIVWIVLLIASIWFVLNFSYSTSPLTPYYWGGDTAQFLTMGKAWYLGKIPYRNMFDHKGPLIFFVDMLGFALTRGSSATGVAVIQIVVMFFSLAAFYNIGKLFFDDVKFGLLTCGLTLVATKVNYIEENTVEEYCIPFIAWSLYGIMKWLSKKQYDSHNPRWGILYGITFAVCLLTRVTNAVTIIPGILIILLLLIKEKNFENIVLNAGAFLGGAFALIIPFSIYFAIKGCFFEYLDGMLFYNIKYANARQSWLHGASSTDIVNFLKTFFLAWCIFIAGWLCVLRKEYLKFVFYVFTGMLELYLFLSGDAYGQYAYVCLPQICFLIGEIGYSVRADETSKVVSLLSTQMLCWFLSVCILDSMCVAPEIHRTFSAYHDRGWDSLIQEIPESEKNSFVAYGDNRLKEIYLLNDLMPCYKYFSIQEWHASMSDETKQKIHDTFATCEAKWILVAGGTSVIQDVLDNDYHLVDSKDDYLLYELNA